MAEKFRETDKAISYLASGLKSDFPDAIAEVILVDKSRPSTQECSIGEIGAVLQRFCKGFHSTSVDYHPDNPYGFVAEVRSHGDDEGNSTKKRMRPRVVVLLAQPGGTRSSATAAASG